MRHLARKYCLLAMVVLMMLTGTTACGPSSWVEDILSFGFGALVASQFQTTSTDYRCFRDGVEVACSELTSFQP